MTMKGDYRGVHVSRGRPKECTDSHPPTHAWPCPRSAVSCLTFLDRCCIREQAYHNIFFAATGFFSTLGQAAKAGKAEKKEEGGGGDEDDDGNDDGGVPLAAADPAAGRLRRFQVT